MHTQNTLNVTATSVKQIRTGQRQITIETRTGSVARYSSDTLHQLTSPEVKLCSVLF